MKKIKCILNIIVVGLFFAAVTAFLMVLLVGAVMFAHSIVTETIPTTYETVGMIFIMLIGSVIGVILYQKDTEE